MLTSLAKKLGLVRARPLWVRELEARGVERRVLDELEDHDELASAWDACRRLDWALAVAVRARVEPALLVAGWAGVASEAASWPGARAWLDAVSAQLEAWMRGELDASLALEATQPHVLSLVEHSPRVVRALTELRSVARWRSRAHAQEIADAYDAAHAEEHARLATRFRRSVSSEALRFALQGHAQSPYR